MGRLTMNEEYHKPFIKSMIIVAFVTLITMISTKYVLEIYSTLPSSYQKSHEYSSQKSQDQVISSVVE